MLTKELRQRVRKLQFKINRLLNSEITAGHYISAFKGTGIEFDEVREYQPGDDVRAIDWNVTARSGVPFIKRYVEERELTVMLLVDLSASQRFGSASTLKKDLAAEISALLAFLAIQSNDKVGLLIFSDRLEKYLPPQKGRRHVLRVIREILGYEAQGRGTDLPAALSFVNRVVKHQSVIFVISDFLTLGFENTIKSTIRRHDVVAIGINDPRESDLPDLGLVELEDLENGAQIILDTADPITREQVRANALHHQSQIQKIFQRNRVDYLHLSTHAPYLQPLQTFFLKRAARCRIR